MSELDPAAQAMLDLVRAEDALAPERGAQILSGLEQRHAAGDLGPELPASSGGSSIGTGKIVLAVLAIAAVAAVPFALGSADEDVPPTPAVQPIGSQPASEEPEQSAVPAIVDAQPTQELPQPASEPSAAPDSAPVSTSKNKKRPRKQDKADTEAVVSDPQAEIRLIRRAQAALSAGNASKARALLDRHAREFPSGLLVEERKVAHAQAQCELGKTEAARREIKAFLRDHPGSVLAERATGVCADGQKKNPTD